MPIGVLQERGLLHGVLEAALASEQEEHRVERNA
jgi:hypothetical protein